MSFVRKTDGYSHLYAREARRNGDPAGSIEQLDVCNRQYAAPAEMFVRRNGNYKMFEGLPMGSNSKFTAAVTFPGCKGVWSLRVLNADIQYGEFASS